MPCEYVKERLFDYLTRRLDGEETGEIASHIKQCSRCRQEAQEMEQLLELLEMAKPPEPPSRFTAQVMKEIQAQKQPLWKRWIKHLSLPPIPALALGIAACIMVFIMYQGWPDRKMKTRQMGLAITYPVEIPSENPRATYATVLSLVRFCKGKVVEEKPHQKGIELIITVPSYTETTFLTSLREMGAKVRAGFKDPEGRIHILIEKVELKRTP